MSGVVARGVGEEGTLSFLPMAFGGHCYYVRKCKMGDLQPDGKRLVGGILLPDIATENTYWAEVVGVGPKVGRPCPDIHRHMHKRARCLSQTATVGELVLLPGVDQGIKRSPYAEYEYFVEESVPRAIYQHEPIEEMAGVA